MSDFLTRMAQLSLGAARVVEPRLGSPFAEEARGEAGQSMQAMREAQPQARSGHPTASGRGMAEPDVEDVPEAARNELEFIFAEDMSEVFDAVFEEAPTPGLVSPTGALGGPDDAGSIAL